MRPEYNVPKQVMTEKYQGDGGQQKKKGILETKYQDIYMRPKSTEIVDPAQPRIR